MAAQKQKYIALAIVLSSIASTAFFLAQGTTGILAATFLGVEPAGAGGVAAAPAAPQRTRRRDDTQILRRNIFDSEQGPLDGEPVDETPADETETPVDEWDPSQPPPACDGSMRLVAAVVNPRRDEWSFAAIIGAAGKAMLYRAGQEVDGRTIVAVLPNRVYMRPSTGRICQIAMFADEEGAPRVASRTPTRVSTMAAETPQRPPRPTREGAISSADLEAGITRNSDTNFTIQRGLVDQILENQAELMRTARIIPHEENGRVVGVKMYGIRRNSLLGRLGVQNGDMLRTINGYDMASPDSALEAYARLRSADHLTLSIVRRGSPATIDYNIQ